MARHKRQTAYQKATRFIEEEGRRQCFLLYSATAITLFRHWGKKRDAITRLFEASGAAWGECAGDNMRSMIEMCEKETGIEIQNGDGKSWHDLPYLNATLDTRRMSNAQWVYLRQQQARWVAPQVMACILVAMHRKYGFGFDRCARFYAQVQEVEAEFRMDPKRIQAACLEETGVNIFDVIAKPKEVKEVV